MKQPINKPLLAVLISSLVITYSFADTSSEDDELLDLSLEELISLDVPDVTSVSRKKQRLMDSAAAVYVITDEDIQRSGVTSIPEALRMVPGMQIARLNSNTWSISTRGFNYIFANKLLVLVDGRTVYSPLFSGVNWDIQDTMLEDIARIEVIRGPGAALWGANAVNGVINIITKHSADTQGGLLSAGFGSEEKAFGAYRYGGEIGDSGHYRVYYKGFERDGMKNADGSDAADDWKINRAGFRTDWRTDNGARASLQGDIYSGTTRPALMLFNDTSNQMNLITNASRDQKGGHLLGNWKYKYDNNSDISIKAYYDRYENYDYRVTEKRDVGDIEFQHHFQLANKHDLIWGTSFRLTQYKLSDMRNIILPRDSRTDQLYSAFIQDDITFNPQWNLTLSSRFEHNNFTGFEVQPNARITWKAAENRTFWGSISRAVKTPSVSETQIQSKGITFANPLAPIMLGINGNDKLKSEKLVSFELGYRELFADTFKLDVTTFINQYDDLIRYIQDSDCGYGFAGTDPQSGIPVCTDIPGYGSASPETRTPAFIEYPSTLVNGLKAKTYGLEITADWQASDWWKMQFNYSWLQVDAERTASDAFSGANETLVEDLGASNTANIRSSMNLPNQWYLDLWIRYMDNLRSANIPASTTFDFRLAKKFGDDLELSFVGQNIFDSQRLEFREIFSGLGATEVERAWYLQLRWQH